MLGIVGLVGNFFNYLLVSQKKYEKSTTCFYMCCMAVFDCYGRMFLRYPSVMAPHLLENTYINP
jgi:hypothetical protein